MKPTDISALAGEIIFKARMSLYDEIELETASGKIIRIKSQTDDIWCDCEGAICYCNAYTRLIVEEL